MDLFQQIVRANQTRSTDTGDERRVLEALSESGGATTSALAKRLGMDRSVLQQTLYGLLGRRKVAKLNGNRWGVRT